MLFEQRIGFLYGLDDCLTYDTKPALLFTDTWTEYEKEISEYYSKSSSNMSRTVQSVFQSLSKNLAGNKIVSKTARYGDEFWRAHSNLAHLGFIEGYIACRSHDKNAPKWSKPSAYYVQQLNEMYNFDDHLGETAPEYEGSAASALERFHD